ncbi:TPA: hypothetical protein N0F65_009249 [Lagenidium giganteum]|uniref:Uncharacterized protein n=1 Tax=Lagenidium giganteum TaxID=4803 RepID=A0AAV2YK80_9STRA|nr:TPA: hypothetical protein N0F65_009249 [Lagenidium giganteum]
MEHGWPTKKWWHRVFGSIFGMIVTDAYLAHAHNNRHMDVDCFRVFMSKLAHQLIFNDYLSNGKRPRDQNEKTPRPWVPDHALTPLLELPEYATARESRIARKEYARYAVENALIYAAHARIRTRDHTFHCVGRGRDVRAMLSTFRAPSSTTSAKVASPHLIIRWHTSMLSQKY